MTKFEQAKSARKKLENKLRSLSWFLNVIVTGVLGKNEYRLAVYVKKGSKARARGHVPWVFEGFEVRLRERGLL